MHIPYVNQCRGKNFDSRSPDFQGADGVPEPQSRCGSAGTDQRASGGKSRGQWEAGDVEFWGLGLWSTLVPLGTYNFWASVRLWKAEQVHQAKYAPRPVLPGLVRCRGEEHRHKIFALPGFEQKCPELKAARLRGSCVAAATVVEHLRKRRTMIGQQNVQ